MTPMRMPKHVPLPDVHKINRDALSYLNAQNFLQRLNGVTRVITMDEYKALKKQALNGDLDGAEEHLDEVLARHGMRTEG